MHTWTYDLTRLTSSVERLGFHGLSLLLHHGENNPHYPEVVQSPTLKWTCTETAITISFETEADINKLVACQLDRKSVV